MEKVEMSIDIKAPIQKIFEYLTDPNKIPSILSGLVENSNVPELPLKVGSTFNYKYQMYGVMLDGVWSVIDLKSPLLYKAHTTGGIESDWTYQISGEGDNSTVNLAVEYTMPSGILSKIKANALAKINEKEADHLLHNLKTIMEME